MKMQLILLLALLVASSSTSSLVDSKTAPSTKLGRVTRTVAPEDDRSMPCPLIYEKDIENRMQTIGEHIYEALKDLAWLNFCKKHAYQLGLEGSESLRTELEQHFASTWPIAILDFDRSIRKLRENPLDTTGDTLKEM